ncbi:phosphatidylglycerol--prolipoprotein diacylglyceryl transferase-like [Zeugodacus cucurbitae]|uniref:phosphatidylglycerol--prolipoprotein diacylglyceryl transferase-like n=1 Tax=Zeugodacus cucurbitae TaxID=28588 RepID=UPI0005967E06|nr:phosphatidylglycerol--prolipoprotein diacylglyceryl transferase-like [Zeugodacus cucurbitae]
MKAIVVLCLLGFVFVVCNAQPAQDDSVSDSDESVDGSGDDSVESPEDDESVESPEDEESDEPESESDESPESVENRPRQ